MPRVPTVAVWIETSRAYGRGLIEGVSQYVHRHGPWSIYFTPHGLDAALPQWLCSWRGDGILARIDNLKMARALLATKLPLIDLRGRLPGLGVPVVGLQNQPVAQMAFEHLRARGFRHYGFYGLARGEHVHMDQRCDYFVEQVTQAGFACHVFEVPRGAGAKSWDRRQRHLAQWLRRLPRPIGLMCCNDDQGQQLLDTCVRSSIAVPDEVAVISVDNDQVLCNICTPPLTSIDVNPARIGYQAAGLLAQMMRRPRAKSENLHFAPSHVVTRQSTDTLAVDDPLAAAALRFIRLHACRGIVVGDVVSAVAASRRLLERRLQSAVGRTPHAEIMRVRIERATQLLLDTDLSLASVAAQAGFVGPKYFCDAFCREKGMPPGTFRRQSRGTVVPGEGGD